MKNWHQFVFYDNKLSLCPLSLLDASHKSLIHVSVRILTIKISQWARENFCSYRKSSIWPWSSEKYSVACRFHNSLLGVCNVVKHGLSYIMIKHERQSFIGTSQHREKSWNTTCAEHFWQNSRCLDSRWNTVLIAWYIFYIERKNKEWIERKSKIVKIYAS